MKFIITKTISYDLNAIVEAESYEALKNTIETNGDDWIDYDQSDGSDEVMDIHPFIPEKTINDVKREEEEKIGGELPIENES